MTTTSDRGEGSAPDPDGFATARFGRRHHAAGRREPEPLRFRDVFAAVLLALCVFSIAQGLIVWYVVSTELDRMQREIAIFVESMEPAWTQTPAELHTPRARGRASAHAPPLPGYPGPVTAKANGASHACAGGRTVRRLPNGWEDVGGRCRATSQ
ncbi:hypothetical protein E5843_07965 [Luteimonas yindakuii]|uniref:hypothetical protein n=1 Tax=Luteimonas yindakuii TaxID=2565782 RepID=UPI0010A4B8D4|nr:hypothetical protein [Luteimonas yindakuii]QCO67721.1 hypothetical protein E5843_07965 [Luteimonas yindakuii]